MARKCASKMLLDVLDEARMRTLDPDVRMLWLDIARMMQRDEISILRFGNQVLKPQGLSRLISRPESETETELETKITELVARGLLAREADGAISCPMLQAQQSRSEINRQNGLKGGRRRKDGTVPGQQAMLLPINGGAEMKSDKTEMLTENVDAGSANNNHKIPIEITDKDYHALGSDVQKLVGCDPVKKWLDYGIIRQWLADGAGPELIRSVVGDIMQRQSPTITSLRYFNNAIAQAISSQPKVKPQWEVEWERDNRLYELTGRGQRPMVDEYKARFAA